MTTPTMLQLKIFLAVILGFQLSLAQSPFLPWQIGNFQPGPNYGLGSVPGYGYPSYYEPRETPFSYFNNYPNQQLPRTPFNQERIPQEDFLYRQYSVGNVMQNNPDTFYNPATVSNPQNNPNTFYNPATLSNPQNNPNIFYNPSPVSNPLNNPNIPSPQYGNYAPTFTTPLGPNPLQGVGTPLYQRPLPSPTPESPNIIRNDMEGKSLPRETPTPNNGNINLRGFQNQPPPYYSNQIPNYNPYPSSNTPYIAPPTQYSTTVEPPFQRGDEYFYQSSSPDLALAPPNSVAQSSDNNEQQPGLSTNPIYVPDSSLGDNDESLPQNHTDPFYDIRRYLNSSSGINTNTPLRQVTELEEPNQDIQGNPIPDNFEELFTNPPAQSADVPSGGAVYPIGSSRTLPDITLSGSPRFLGPNQLGSSPGSSRLRVNNRPLPQPADSFDAPGHSVEP